MATPDAEPTVAGNSSHSLVNLLHAWPFTATEAGGLLFVREEPHEERIPVPAESVHAWTGRKSYGTGQRREECGGTNGLCLVVDMIDARPLLRLTRVMSRRQKK